MLFTAPAAAQQSADFPRRSTFIIHLTSSQYASGLGEYLVPPLERAMAATGLRYRGDAGADYAATVQSRSDTGQWLVDGDGRQWLYTREVTVGLSPADADIDTGGGLRPSFSITAILRTPDADRVDELNCLISLAARELAARYVPAGSVAVDGNQCARR
ncbi:MAG: hypothetical protein R3D84_04060 [Paracoccaceae bacterium]